MVRLNRFGLDPRYPPGAAWALAFYHEGHLAKRYDCEHLLTGLKNPQFFELKTWDWYSKWFDTFEVKGSHLVLSTARRRLGLPTGHMLDLGLQEFYTFDLPTGIIVSRSATGGGLIWWYTLIVTYVLLAIFIGWWLSRRYRSNELAG